MFYTQTEKVFCVDGPVLMGEDEQEKCEWTESFTVLDSISLKHRGCSEDDDNFRSIGEV